MNTQNKVTITIGTGTDKAGQPITNDYLLHAKQRAKVHLAETYPGYTLVNTVGGWMDEGVSVTEPGLMVILLLNDLDMVHVEMTAKYLRDVFKQNCVLLTHEKVQAALI